MTILIILFAALMFLAGVIILIKPTFVFDLLAEYSNKPGLQIAAITGRLLFGLLLISQAEFSKFPLTIEVMAWIAIIAALVMALMGSDNFKRLMSWVLSTLRPYAQVGGVCALVFGLFLMYAFI